MPTRRTDNSGAAAGSSNDARNVRRAEDELHHNLILAHRPRQDQIVLHIDVIHGDHLRIPLSKNSAMITRVSCVIRPKGSDLIFDHPYLTPIIFAG